MSEESERSFTAQIQNLRERVATLETHVSDMALQYSYHQARLDSHSNRIAHIEDGYRGIAELHGQRKAVG